MNEEEYKGIIKKIINANIGKTEKEILERVLNIYAEKIPNFDPKNFINNIESFKFVSEKAQNIIKGDYSPLKNTVHLYKNADERVIMHEMLHFASVDRTEIENGIKDKDESSTIICGIEKYKINLNEGKITRPIGRRYLNEGITEYLVSKIRNTAPKSYIYNSIVANVLENGLLDHALTDSFFKTNPELLEQKVKETFGSTNELNEIYEGLETHRGEQGEFNTQNVKPIMEIQNSILDMFEKKCIKLNEQGRDARIPMVMKFVKDSLVKEDDLDKGNDFKKAIAKLSDKKELKEFTERVNELEKDISTLNIGENTRVGEQLQQLKIKWNNNRSSKKIQIEEERD